MRDRSLRVAMLCCSLVIFTHCMPDPDGRGGQSMSPLPDSGVPDVTPEGCELTKSLRESPACIADEIGVFVDAAGDDSAPGTKTAPVKTIAKGVELAATKSLSRVYVCEGTYDTNVEVKQAVAIFGGLNCTWAPSEAARPKLAPPRGIALKVAAVDAAVRIEDIDIVAAADSSVAGDSAIGCFISESRDVKLTRVNVTAGAGSKGEKGASRSNYAEATAMKGANGSAATAGVATTCTCTDGTSSTGGAGASGAGAGLQNGSAIPPISNANSGLTGPTTCTDGQPGANGAAGGAGAAPTSPGTLSAAGWSSATTTSDAPNGNPAQGGGGGGAKTDVNSAGGGGGCGGCGGAGGAPGGNGGSSFALLAFNSTVIVEGGALSSGDGGRGGDGGDGQAGQAPGGAGTGPACNGGPGGSGAGGSGGSGGAGGHSAPVAFVGQEPTVRSQTSAGAPGPGGGPGAPGGGPGNPGAAGTPGPDGSAQPSLRL